MNTTKRAGEETEEKTEGDRERNKKAAYLQRVDATARHILTRCDSASWKREKTNDGEKPEFFDFYNDMEYDGSISSEIDACAEMGDWKAAIAVLEVTDINPDHVDPGLYEGCDWKKMLICIAYDCFSQEVQARMQELFEDDEDMTPVVRGYPSNDHQIGYFPKVHRYEIPKAPWTINLGSGVKVIVYEQGKRRGAGPSFRISTIFEGKIVKENSRRYLVDAVRVYNQTDRLITEELEECLNCYEVIDVEEEKEEER